MFYWSGSQINGALPACFGAAATQPALRFVSITQSQLQSVSAPLFANAALVQLQLSYNAISGSLPAVGAAAGVAGTGCALANFDVSFNAFTGAVPAVSQCRNLTSFTVASNSFTALASPAGFDGLAALISLSLKNNSIVAPLPTLRGCSSLTSLVLANNSFYGDAPSSWTGLSALTALDLRCVFARSAPPHR
jgi:Leucine-rich repeat (LRR) protein